MSAPDPTNPRPEVGTDVASVVERNIAALLDHRRKHDRQRTRSEQVADAIGRFAGSLASVYAHLVYFGIWAVINLGWTPIEPFDPTFVVLAMLASVEAIFLSTFVLMMQNRLASLSEQRAELDLQISLLAEHEITRVLQLTLRLGEKLGVDVSNPEFEQLKKDVAPEQVLERMDQVHNHARDAAGP